MKKTSIKQRHLYLGAMLFSLWASTICAQETVVSNDTVLFQLTTDRSEYRLGENASVRFTVANRGKEPLYLNRNLGTCGRWTGYVELAILDQKNHKLSRVGCDVFVTTIPDDNLKAALNSGDWVLLLPGKAYSAEERLDLPENKGQYVLVADLRPPAFSEGQLHLLSSQGIRVLQSSHSAPRITVVVK